MWSCVQRRLPSRKTVTLILVITCVVNVLIVRNHGIYIFRGDDVIAERDSGIYTPGKNTTETHHAASRNVTFRERLIKVKENAGGSNKSTRNIPDKARSIADRYGLSDLLFNVDYKLEAEYAAKGGPMDYLPGYNNPCWMSSISPLTHLRPGTFNKRRAIIPWNRKSLSEPKLRCAPGVYQVGAAGSGTTDLYKTLTQFSDGQLIGGSIKEPKYWSDWRTKQATFSEYLDLYSSASDTLAETTKIRNGTRTPLLIDGSTFNFIGYKDWRLIPANRGQHYPVVTIQKTIKTINPRSKIIIIARNPADRLLSQFRSMLGTSPGTSGPEAFDRAVRRIIPLWESCIRSRGAEACLYDYHSKLRSAALKAGIIVQHSMYYFWVRRWMEEFGSNNVILLRAEDYYQDKVKHTNRVLKFLGLEPLSGTAVSQVKISKKANNHKSQPMLPKTREYLDNFFRPYNKKLAEYVEDDKFLWDDT